MTDNTKQTKPNNLTILEYTFYLTNTTSKITAKTEKDVKKRRSPERKYGKYKWLRMLIDRNTTELREIRRIVSGVSRGLSYLMDFDSEYLLKMVCRDSRDEVILDVLRAAGPCGLSPKTIHAKVRSYGLKYHHITRRIKRMNRRMQMRLASE